MVCSRAQWAEDRFSRPDAISGSTVAARLSSGAAMRNPRAPIPPDRHRLTPWRTALRLPERRGWQVP